MKKLIVIFGILILGALNIFAQNGGKAEPNRIQIPKGQTSVTLKGDLSENQQAEYVFSAKKDQLVLIWVDSIKPTGKFYSFTVKGAENQFASQLPRFEVEKFQAPETDDYLIFVKFRPMGKIKKGSYKMTLDIKN